MEYDRMSFPELRMRVENRDITLSDCACIVNAANPELVSSGGVNGAIHRAAGPQLLEECRKLGGCRIGEAKITGGYRLKAGYIIHTAGPVYGTPNADELLSACYRNALELAAGKNAHTAAFPLLSSGKQGYPKEKAARIAIIAVREWQKAHWEEIPMEVTFCCTDPEAYEIIKAYMHDLQEEYKRLTQGNENLVFRQIRLQFYPEDEEKMKSMSVRERIAYCRMLKDQNRYIILNPEDL